MSNPTNDQERRIEHFEYGGGAPLTFPEDCAVVEEMLGNAQCDYGVQCRN